MEKLPNVIGSWPRSTAISSASSNGNTSEIARLAKSLLGCFRTGDANDPEIYTAAAIAVLSDYPLDVVRRVVDPRTGLPSKCKWLPMIAEIKDACEEQMEPRRRMQVRQRQFDQQMAEREEFLRNRLKA